MKIFLLLFNRKSGHRVGAVSLERLGGFECNFHQIGRH